MEDYISNKYKISLENKHTFWITKVINNWITSDNKCPSSNLKILKLKKIKSIYNTFKLQGSNYK